eukprot:914300_1
MDVLKTVSNMHYSYNLFRRLHHGGSHLYQCIRTRATPRKLLFGSTILFGAVAPTLLSDSFQQFSLETHSGDSDAKKTFNSKYGHILKWYDDQPLLYAMIGINIAVYAFWKVNPQLMHKHFLCNLENVQSKRYHVLLTSSWSHMDFWHIGLNMYVLYNFGSIMIRTIGIPAFGGIYLGAGILGSVASLSWHVFTKIPHYSSLGASASLLGIICAFALHEPDARFKIILSPDSLSFSAQNGIIGLIIFDTLGLLLRWRFLDHAAHLSGAFFGFCSWNIIRRVFGTSKGNNDLLCINGQYIYEGQFKDYKIDSDHGKIYSPTKTYHGEMLLENKFLFHGKGSIRNEMNGSVFYGYFNRGHIDGLGLLCLDNGKMFPATYDQNAKEFRMPDVFDPRQLTSLLNDKFTNISYSTVGTKDKNKDKDNKQKANDENDIESKNH